MLQLSAARTSRRREFDADRGSAEATGDAAGLITGLTRLNRANRLPDSWGWWDGLFLTHPPTTRRIAALAALGRLSPQQVAASRGLAEAEPETYSLPPSAVAGATVFSPEFRRRTLNRLSLTALTAAILPPFLAALVAGLVEPGPLADAALIAGAVLPTVIYVCAANRVAPAGSSALEERVRAKFSAEGLDVSQAEFVSFAPDGETRIYDGFSQWDVGLLWLAGDRLVYVGERTRFALAAEDVTGIHIGRGLPSWLPTRRVYLTWQDPTTGAGGTFAVWPGAAKTTLQLANATKEFADRLRAWKDGDAAAQLPAALLDLGPPEIGPVHSVSPKQVVPPRAWLRSLVLLGPLTAGLCVLAGLPFEVTVLDGAGYVLAVMVASLAAQVLPYWLATEPVTSDVPELTAAIARCGGRRT